MNSTALKSTRGRKAQSKSTAAVKFASGPSLVGRTFIHPVFDYLVIGGGLSLILIAALLALGWNSAAGLDRSLPLLYLFFNSAHFAASTVRLYTKNGTFEKLPFVTMALPLVAILVLLAGLKWPQSLGLYINKLYLTWSPFHYAATAYGLALIYSYRSGCRITAGQKKLLRWTSLLPFLYAIGLQELGGVSGWFLTPAFLSAYPDAASWLHRLVMLAGLTSFALPFLLYLSRWKAGDQPLPLIVLMLLVSNGIWWIVFTSYTNAFNLATIFHGVQYLAIVSIFHVKEKVREPDNRRSAAFHALWFYLVCLGLAVALFQFWPYAFVMIGFGKTESILMVIAIINIHHFIVDAYIWKLKSDTGNKSIIVSGAAA